MMPQKFPDQHLKGSKPLRYADKIAEIEAELDAIHPGWSEPVKSRRGRGMKGTIGIEDIELKARVKYLLQRRKHLYAGKDWEVVIKSITGGNGQVRLWAMPLIPRGGPTPEQIAAAAVTPLIETKAKAEKTATPKAKSKSKSKSKAKPKAKPKS